MKIMIKKKLGLVLFVLFVLNFSACSSGGKYKFNANNGFYIWSDNLDFIRNGKYYNFNLEDGEHEVYSGETKLPKEINTNDIIALNGGYIFVKKNNTIVRYEEDFEEDVDVSFFKITDYYKAFEIQNNKYKSIVIPATSWIIIHNKDSFSTYFLDDKSEWNLHSTINLEKEYDSSFLLSLYMGELILGFVKGNTIDIVPVNFKEGTAEVIKQLELDKQYDAYVGYLPDGDILYLGCIENNKIRFLDTRSGVFVKKPFTGEELSWVF